MSEEDEYIKKLESLCSNAVPGPWRITGFGTTVSFPDEYIPEGYEDDSPCVCYVNDDWNTPLQKGTIEFIAESRTAIPFLLEEIKRLRKL